LGTWQKIGNLDCSSAISHDGIPDIQSQEQPTARIEFQNAADVSTGLGAVRAFSGKERCAGSAHTERIAAEVKESSARFREDSTR
jgi:hypothetical protein